jgi:hypothetical protein
MDPPSLRPLSRGYPSRMDWPASSASPKPSAPTGRTRLLRILEASDEDRAATIGRLHLRDDGALLEELLIELEEKEWARQAVIEELRRQ